MKISYIVSYPKLYFLKKKNRTPFTTILLRKKMKELIHSNKTNVVWLFLLLYNAESHDQKSFMTSFREKFRNNSSKLSLKILVKENEKKKGFLRNSKNFYFLVKQTTTNLIFV